MESFGEEIKQMGGGYGDLQYDTKILGGTPQSPASDLHGHPSLKFNAPPSVASATRLDIAKIVRYALDCAARLVSPSPQLRNENAAFDCKDVAREIKGLGAGIVRDVQNVTALHGSTRQLICPQCRLRFSLQADFVDAFRSKGRAFYCPNSYCGDASKPPTRLYFPEGKAELAIAE